MTRRLQGGPDGGASGSVWNRHLMVIFAITFLAYANNSVFFSYYEYLRAAGIEPRLIGLLIAVFSAASLMVRPLISPFIHSANARACLFGGTLMVVAALAAYSLTGGFWSMLGVRIFHGLAFVIMGTALMALTIDYIPAGRSAQVFGLLAVVILVPNTIIPPLLPGLEKALGGFNGVLLGFALVTLLVFGLVGTLKKPAALASRQAPDSSLSRQEILQAVCDPATACLLAGMLFFYSSHALVFFFLDGYGHSLGISATGLFMTLATAAEIGVRLAAGSLFDRLNKALVAAVTMAGLAVAYWLLGKVSSAAAFFSLGAVLGLGWGVAMPVFNGLMFDISTARLRAFNLNLGLQMFQGGFFLGPFIGAPVVAALGFGGLFNLCGALALVAAVLVLYLKHRMAK